METKQQVFAFAFAAQILFLLSGATDGQIIGVNYGRKANNLPAPEKVVALLQDMGVGMVKIFDANESVLSAFANSGISLWIMVPDEDIHAIASNQCIADLWIYKYVVEHYPFTQIRAILVGNEVLSSSRGPDIWFCLVPAMKNIAKALDKFSLSNIKVSTALSGDVLIRSHPPSSGEFRPDIAEIVMKPMLQFLSQTRSFLSINPYPYFAYAKQTDKVDLEYALLKSSRVVVQDGVYGYTNLLDAMLDARFVAMEKLGFADIPLAIGETGWPSDGDIGACKSYASQYNQRLITKILSSKGTPRRPNRPIPPFIFSLFNENLKSSRRERSWGLLYPSGYKVYDLDFSL